VPETILSRCQQFEFRHIAAEKIFQRLREIAGAEQVKISDAALREVARAGAGSLRDAQSAFDQVIAFSGAEITEEDVAAALGLVGARTLGRFVEVIAEQNGAGILSLIEEIVSRGYDLRNFTRELMAYLRHMLVIKSGITSSEVLGVADVEIEQLNQLAARFSEEDLVRFFHLLAATEKEIKDSPHPRFQLEIGLMKITHATRLRSLDEVIARLEALEANLTGGASRISNAGTAPTLKDNRPGETPSERPGKATSQRRESSSSSSRPPAEPPPPPPSYLEEPPGFNDDHTFDQPEPDFAPPPRPARSAPGPSAPSAAAPAPTIERGREVEAIRAEIQRLNRGLLLTAFEDAQSLTYSDGKLLATFASDDVFAKRLRESSALFREIGERLFGQPLRVEVRLSGQAESPRVDEAAQARERLRERALNNPKVRAVIEKFRGELVDVRELSPNAES